MSRHTFTRTGALALCLMLAGVAQVAQAQPLSSAQPQASPVIILAQTYGEPGVPRGAKCVGWVSSGHGKLRCNQFCYPRYEKC
jgi:hypothetical protein